MRHYPSIALCALALAQPACKEAPRPVAPRTTASSPTGAGPTAPASSASAASTAPAAQADWSYSSVGKRDPFRSFLAELKTTGNSLVTRCSTKLGRYELEQLKLVAVVTGLDDPLAMVEAPNGEGLTVRRGACIGKNGGVVTAVRTGEVVVSEWAIRADGTRDKTQTLLKLPKEALLNLEE